MKQMLTVDANIESSITIKHSTYQAINEDIDVQRKKAYEIVYQLSKYLKDEQKALTAWRKGLTLQDFEQPEFEGLAPEWVWKYLRVDEMPNTAS